MRDSQEIDIRTKEQKGNSYIAKASRHFAVKKGQKFACLRGEYCTELHKLLSGSGGSDKPLNNHEVLTTEWEPRGQAQRSNLCNSVQY